MWVTPKKNLSLFTHLSFIYLSVMYQAQATGYQWIVIDLNILSHDKMPRRVKSGMEQFRVDISILNPPQDS